MRLFVLFFVAFSLQVFSQAVSPDIEELIKQNPNYLNSLGKDEIFEGSGSEGNDKSIDSSLPSSDLEVSEESKIFGFDYIKSIPKSITATSDLPVTNDYLISIGDELRVMLTGGKENVYILEVLMDGSILFPGLGPVNVFGESILDIRKTLESLVQLSYVGTEVSVSLESLAAKKINIIGAVKRGIDMFDCVMPTRSGRTGLAFTWEGKINLKNSKYKYDKNPLNKNCDLENIKNFSKSYLNHLIKTNEILASMIISLNNVYFYQQFMFTMRQHILKGTFKKFYNKYINLF